MFRSYLTDRLQQADVEVKLSSVLNVKYCVLPDSILDQLLFVIYIKDLLCDTHIESMYVSILFPDYITFLVKHANQQVPDHKIQNAQNYCLLRFGANNLCMNRNNTNCGAFSRRSTTCTHQEPCKYTGVLDAQLNWKDHINKFSPKLLSTLYVFRKIYC